jgi:hypothetical protein
VQRAKHHLGDDPHPHFPIRPCFVATPRHPSPKRMPEKVASSPRLIQTGNVFCFDVNISIDRPLRFHRIRANYAIRNHVYRIRSLSIFAHFLPMAASSRNRFGFLAETPEKPRNVAPRVDKPARAVSGECRKGARWARFCSLLDGLDVIGTADKCAISSQPSGSRLNVARRDPSKSVN